MNAQVDRLQALLQRVHDNRQKPRAAARPVAAAAAAPTARMVAEPKAPAAPPRAAAPAPVAARPLPAAMPTQQQVAPAPSATDARPKPKAPTPLELAVEGRISQPLSPSPQPVRSPVVNKAPVAVAQARPVQEGTLVADVAPAEPSKPIAHVVSTHPPFTSLSFGELLRRSLSLRPR